MNNLFGILSGLSAGVHFLSKWAFLISAFIFLLSFLNVIGSSVSLGFVIWSLVIAIVSFPITIIFTALFFGGDS